MKVLVTGSDGQVGRALIASALPGMELTALPRSACDIDDFGLTNECIRSVKPHVIFNTAAYTAVDKAEGEPAAAYRTNAEAVRNLAKIARDSGSRLVHISTDFVFDGLSSHPYRPDDAPNPINVYGWTKWEGEKAALAVDPRALIVRSAWVYGPNSRNFVNTMLRLMTGEAPVRVISDQVGTPTSALALAGALWRLVALGAEGTFHYTDSGVASWYDFAIAIQEEALKRNLIAQCVPVLPIPTGEYPTTAKRPSYSVLDKHKTWSALGGAAAHWRVALRHMLEEVQAHA